MRVETIADRVHRKLCSIGFSGNHRSGISQIVDNASIIARREIFPKRTSHLSRKIDCIEDVFYTDRNSFQSTSRRTGRKSGFSITRLRVQTRLIERHPDFVFLAEIPGALETNVSNIARRQIAELKFLDNRANRLLEKQIVIQFSSFSINC
jgi:hypothetical protein